MHRFITFIRRPVKREGAEQYVLVMLLAFAASVSVTRLFLSLTGYPQLGGGDLHIAHVLWGGLLLFIASLLPLVIANRWALTLASLLSGVGVGLFIDEVGKFITANNNYFYPLAAPIIYAFFLLTTLLYLRVRRPPSRGPRAELYRAFDAMEEVLEHDLDPVERAELVERLRYVAEQKDFPDLARLAHNLLEFLAWDEIRLSERRPGFVERWLERWRNIESRYLNRWRVKALLAGGLLALALLALSNMLRALPIPATRASLQNLLTDLIEAGRLSTLTGLNWFSARLALETSVGVLLLSAFALLIAGRDRLGTAFAYLGLLLSLTTVNLLVFYFNQFATVLYAVVQFALLLCIAYYRNRYLPEPPSRPLQAGPPAQDGAG